MYHFSRIPTKMLPTQAMWFQVTLYSYKATGWKIFLIAIARLVAMSYTHLQNKFQEPGIEFTSI
jgi:hypothetical protein